jgi:hypothetical protein
VGSESPAQGSTALVELVDGDECIAIWPLTGVRRDLVVVDRLARLQLGARRLGWSIRVRNADAELSALLRFVGLAEVLPLEPGR